MPKGPNGERRPADVVGCAVTVARVATGEIEEDRLRQPAKRKSGLAGAKARVAATTPARRSEIASIAAKARWGQ